VCIHEGDFELPFSVEFFCARAASRNRDRTSGSLATRDDESAYSAFDILLREFEMKKVYLQI
jgi:hypothetical protein